MNSFIKEIKDYRDNKNIQLYYNSIGNPLAFKNGVRHLSSAPSYGIALKIGDFIEPLETIYIVDFEKKSITPINTKIKLIPLKYY